MLVPTLSGETPCARPAHCRRFPLLPRARPLATPTSHQSASASSSAAPPVLELAALRRMKPDELFALATQLGIEDARDLRRQEVVLAILEAHADILGETLAEGILEILPDGFGFLRSPDAAYQPGIDDI